MPMRTYTLAASLVLGLATTASAAVESHEELVHETTTSVDLELTPETVLCSHADYSAEFLKVLIPQLASLTLLDHQNADAGAPCVAAGECAPFGDHAPADILDEGDTTETVDLTVREFRTDDIDHDAQTCTTSLRERVDLVIRGVAFAHERYAALGTRPYADCISSTGDDDDDGATDPADDGPADDGAGDGDDKSDDYGAGDEPGDETADDEGGASDSAGCAAGGTGASSGLALVIAGLAFAASRRRRR